MVIENTKDILVGENKVRSFGVFKLNILNSYKFHNTNKGLIK